MAGGRAFYTERTDLFLLGRWGAAAGCRAGGGGASGRLAERGANRRAPRALPLRLGAVCCRGGRERGAPREPTLLLLLLTALPPSRRRVAAAIGRRPTERKAISLVHLSGTLSLRKKGERRERRVCNAASPRGWGWEGDRREDDRRGETEQKKAKVGQLDKGRGCVGAVRGWGGGGERRDCGRVAAGCLEGVRRLLVVVVVLMEGGEGTTSHHHSPVTAEGRHNKGANRRMEWEWGVPRVR